jgi:hypothetical protein
LNRSRWWVKGERGHGCVTITGCNCVHGASELLMDPITDSKRLTELVACAG